MSDDDQLRECQVCKKRGQWATVRIGNDVWWLCYHHIGEYRLMVLAWFQSRGAH